MLYEPHTSFYSQIHFLFRQRQKYIAEYLPWAIKTGWESKFLMNVYFEKHWDQPLEELQRELNIKPLDSEKGTYINLV